MTGIRLIQDSDGNVDLELSGGQMAVGETHGQEMWLAVMTHPGDWKEHPWLGVALPDMAGDSDLPYWKRETIDQLRRIGITVKNMTIKEGSVVISDQ